MSFFFFFFHKLSSPFPSFFNLPKWETTFHNQGWRPWLLIFQSMAYRWNWLNCSWSQVCIVLVFFALVCVCVALSYTTEVLTVLILICFGQYFRLPKNNTVIEETLTHDLTPWWMWSWSSSIRGNTGDYKSFGTVWEGIWTSRKPEDNQHIELVTTRESLWLLAPNSANFLDLMLLFFFFFT